MRSWTGSQVCTYFAEYDGPGGLIFILFLKKHLFFRWFFFSCQGQIIGRRVGRQVFRSGKVPVPKGVFRPAAVFRRFYVTLAHGPRLQGRFSGSVGR